MTHASTVLQSYRLQLTSHGEQIKIRRYIGTGMGRTFTDTNAKARVRGYLPNELVGTIQQGDRNIIVLAEDLELGGFALPITAADKAVVRGKELAILGVDDNTRRVGPTLIAIELQCRG